MVSLRRQIRNYAISNTEMLREIVISACVALLAVAGRAQGVEPLPTLHQEGRWLVDSHGNHVVLHGVMDTPNAWFNGGR